MSVARVRAASTLRSALRPSTNGSARSQFARMTRGGQRRWQSDHGAEHKTSSDIPWAIGAVVSSVVGSYFLWPSAHSADAGHHGAHGEEHHEEESADTGDEAQEQEESASTESADDSGKEDKSQDDKTDNDSGKEEKPDDSQKDSGKQEKSNDSQKDSGKEEKSDDSQKDSGKDDESDSKKASKDSDKPTGGDDAKGAKYASNPDGKDAPQFKGKMKEDAEGQSDTRKSESQAPSKGTNKKRIDSGAQKDLGSDQQVGEGATARSEGEPKSDMEKKQAGLSNTDTRHSTAIDQDESKSKKGEGAPETAKNKGTVDPSRPAR